MTDQEKKLQRAAVQMDLEDAESDLAHLQVKAQRWADNLENIAHKLRESAAMEPSKRDFTLEADLANRLEPDEQAALNDTKTVRLLEELKAARGKVYNLRLQKDSLTGGAAVTASVL